MGTSQSRTGDIDYATWTATAVRGVDGWSDPELWVLALPKRVGTRRRISFGLEAFYIAPWLLDDPVSRDGLEFLVPGGEVELVRDPRDAVCQWRRNDEAMLIDPVSWIRTRVTVMD